MSALDSIGQFKQQIRESLKRDTLNSRIVRLARNQRLYASGESDGNVYLVITGLIKSLVLTPERKECLVDIYPAGEIFGELSLCGQITRLETAAAMEDSTVKHISSRGFLKMLEQESLLDGLVQYLACRMAEQQQIITSLATANCEQRLAITLLRLARRLGRKDPQSIRIAHRISQSELANMVGTTRTRISLFLKKFRSLGLIDLNGEQHLIVRESSLFDYLEALLLEEDTGANPFDQRLRPARAAEARTGSVIAGGSST